MTTTLLEKVKYYSYLVARPPPPAQYCVTTGRVDTAHLDEDQTDSAILTPLGTLKQQIILVQCYFIPSPNISIVNAK